MFKTFEIINSKIKSMVIGLIKLYQRYISPDHSIFSKHLGKPPFCKYYPTCSQYMIDSIETNGLFLGIFYGLKRIFRCMPWSKGGYDPVKKSK